VGLDGAAVVATGPADPVPAFCVVVQPETHASRITSTAKRKEYRSNLMMFNIKITLIIVTISIRQVPHFAVLPEIRYTAIGEKLLCPPAPTFLYAHFCVL
jgi:hypothetical protein